MNVPQFGSTVHFRQTETSRGVVTATRPCTKGTLVTLQQGNNPSSNDVGRIALKSVHGKYQRAARWSC